MEFTPLSDFDYRIVNNKIVLSKYNGDGFCEINIPSTYKLGNNEYQVSKIDESAFENSRIIKVKIGEGIELEKNCFFNCKLLKSVILPNSLKIIPIKAFAYCNGLTEINLENTRIIKPSAFMMCENLTQIDIPNVVELGGFTGCKRLKEVKNANKVEVLYARAFAYCDKLRKFYFSPTIKTIYEEAFKSSGLLEVTLPNVLLDGRGIFSHCENLNTVYLDEKIEIIPRDTFWGDKELKIDLKNIKEIKEEAFYLCILENITLNNCELNSSFRNAKIKNININNCSLFDNAFELSTIEIAEISGKTHLCNSAFFAATVNRMLIKNDVEFVDTNEIVFRDCKINIDSNLFDIPIKANKEVNINFKENYDYLLNNDYNLKQINQIFKGYELDLFLSNLSPKFNEEIMREILIAYKKKPIETQIILNDLINKKESLDAEIKLHRFLSATNDDFLLYIEDEREK